MEGGGRRLSREEFDEVIRRATELAAREGESGDLTEDELFRIAGEVGLPEAHVRRALVDVRTAGASYRPEDALARMFGNRTVRAARVVPGAADDLTEVLDEFLVGGQLLEPVRQSRELLQYRPAVDWASKIARAASSTSRRHYVASSDSVDVRFESLEDEEGRTLVELEVDPGTRGDAIAGGVFGGLAVGAAAGWSVGALLTTVVPLSLAVVVGVLVGPAVAWGVAWGVGRSHRKKLGEVRAEVEGILDRLESGESLEPPPPSWRRWVKRHFHGARTLLDEGTHEG